MKNRKPLRIGVIGCGWIMRSTYVPTLLSLPEQAQVVAVCDLNAGLANEVAGHFANVAVFTDAKMMLKAAGLDAVLVLTTEKVNARMARMVMEANLPVYQEKPPAVNSAELEELIYCGSRQPDQGLYGVQPATYAACCGSRFLSERFEESFRGLETRGPQSRDISVYGDPCVRFRAVFRG